MSTKELVEIGQRWERNRGKAVWEIKQIYRAGYGEVLLLNQHGDKITESCADLRRLYTLLPA